MALPSANRLPAGRILQVLRKGRSMNHGPLSVKFIPGNAGVSRIGVLISGKVLSKANERNSLRRCITEEFRNNKKILALGMDFIIKVLKAGDKSSRKEYFRGQIESIMRGLIK